MNSAVAIYVVDDDPGHARLVKKNLRRRGVTNDIEVFSGGQQLLDQIRKTPDVLDRPLLVLLDLNMPGLSGQAVLKEMKGNAQTQHVPIIVLTTTDNPAEVRECYELGCNLYFTKPIQYDQFIVRIRELGLLIQVAAVPSTA